MVKLRSFEKNLPDECRENLLSMRSQTIPTIIEGLSDPDESSLIVWLPAIHRFLDIYKLTRDELSRLISLLYTRIFNSDISLDGLCVTLRLLNRCLSLKSKVSLSVNWKDFYDFYQELLKTSNSFLISKRQISGVFEEISKCIKRSKKFFSDQASTEILEFFRPKICPGGDNTEAVMWICNLMPNNTQSNCQWIHEVTDLLMVDHRNLNWIINVMSCLASAAKWSSGFDWNQILRKLYNDVLPSLPLLNKNLPRPKTYFFEPSPTANLNVQYIKKSSSFAKIIAFTLDLENFELLEQWMRNMQSMIKEGKILGSGFINYISRIVSSYCKRIQKAADGKFPAPSEDLTKKLVSLVLPLVRLIFYSNQLSQIDRLCSHLCFLSPQQTIPSLLSYSIELLQDYEIPHQSVIQALTGMLRPLKEPSIWKDSSDLSIILNLTLLELNPSDMQKTCKILSLYGQLACYEIITNEVWACDFFSNLLNVLAELETSNDGPETSRNLKIEEFLEVSFNVLTDNVSNEIFENWTKEFLEFVTRNNYSNAVQEFGILAKFLVRRNPEILPKLVKMCEGLLSYAKNQVLWRVGIVTEALFFARGLGLSDKVLRIVDEIQEDYPEEAGKLVSALVTGGLDVYPLDYSCVLPKPNVSPVQGRILNQSKTLDLGISWYLPGADSIDKANEIFAKYLLSPPGCKNKLKTYLKVAVSLVKTWSYFIRIKNSTPGFVFFPSLKIYEKLLDFEESMEKVVNSVLSLGFVREDPIVLELFVELLANLIHNVDLTFAFVRMGSKLVNELRKNNFNPLVSVKEKNLNETRPYLIRKTLNLYRKIVSSNYCQKTFDSKYSGFFQLLVEFSQCQFKPVRAKSIASIKYIFKSSFIGLKGIIKQTWLQLTEGLDLQDCEKLKMQMEVLVDHEAVWRKNIIGKDLSIFEVLQKIQKFADIEVQTQFFNYFCNFIMSFYPDCRLVNKRFSIQENREVTEKILSFIDSKSITHWRSQLYLLLLLMIYKNSFSLSQYPQLYRYLAGLVIDENFDIRETAQRVLGSYLWMESQAYIGKTVLESQPGEFSHCSRYLQTSTFSLPAPVHIGWSSCSQVFKVKKVQQETLPQTKAALLELFASPEKVEKLIEYLAVGHMLKSEENIVNNPRTRMNDNVNSSIRFLNNPHKFLEAFFNSPRGFSGDFSEKTAKLVRHFGEICGEKDSQVLFEACEKFILKEKPYQCAALEVLTGLGAASSVWKDSNRFLQALNFSLKHSQINSVNTWSSMLNFSLKKLSLNVKLAVFENLLEQMTLFSNKKLSKILKLLATLTSILAWRGAEIYAKFFDILKSLPHDIFADLRTSVSRVISKIVVYTSYVDKAPSSSWESLKLDEGHYLIYQPCLFDYLSFLSAGDTSYSNYLLLEIIQQLYNEAILDYSVFPLLIRSLDELQGLLRHSDIKIVSKSSDVLKLLSPLRATKELYSQVLSRVQPGFDSKVTEMIKGLMLNMMWFYNQFLVEPPKAFFQDLITKGNLEVKLAAKYYLSTIWRIMDDNSKLLEFQELSSTAADASNCFRLSALILGQKEFIEPWKGQALVRLAGMKKLGGEVSSCVNSTFAEFWKSHKTWWTSFMKYSKEFTEDELEQIESFNSDHSYFS